MIRIKNYAFGVVNIIIFFLSACSSSNDPAPIDCNTSDLALTFTKTDLTSCSTNDGSINASATGGAGPSPAQGTLLQFGGRKGAVAEIAAEP